MCSLMQHKAKLRLTEHDKAIERTKQNQQTSSQAPFPETLESFEDLM